MLVFIVVLFVVVYCVFSCCFVLIFWCSWLFVVLFKVVDMLFCGLLQVNMCGRGDCNSVVMILWGFWLGVAVGLTFGSQASCLFSWLCICGRHVQLWLWLG